MVRRGSIGYLEVSPLTSRLADELRAPTTEGLVVMRMARGAAYQAGLRPGDVIVACNGDTIDDVSHLNRLVADAKIGSTAALKVVRGGHTLDIKVPIVSTKTSRPRR